jgi:hypothetical protein
MRWSEFQPELPNTLLKKLLNELCSELSDELSGELSQELCGRLSAPEVTVFRQKGASRRATLRDCRNERSDSAPVCCE